MYAIVALISVVIDFWQKLRVLRIETQHLTVAIDCFNHHNHHDRKLHLPRFIWTTPLIGLANAHAKNKLH